MLLFIMSIILMICDCTTFLHNLNKKKIYGTVDELGRVLKGEERSSLYDPVI